MGLASTLLGSVFGGIIGLLSGYIGGKTDLITQRVMDILQGLPLLVLALVMSAALGPSIPNVVLAISIPIIPRAARVIRASVLSIREMQYVEAARAVGLRHLRIAFRHVLPNTMGPFIVLVHRAARQRHPGGGRAVVPGPGRARALSLVGPHALGLRGGVRAEGAAGSCSSRASPSASPSSAPTCSATRSATRSIRASAAR